MRPQYLALSPLPLILIGLATGCGDSSSGQWSPVIWPDSGADSPVVDSGADAAKDANQPDASKDGSSDAKDSGAGDAVVADVGPDAPPPVQFSFVAFADNQFATESCTSGVPERLAVPKAIVKLAPTLAIEAGDLMDHGYDPGAYAKLLSCYDAMVTKIPYFPAPGNHDMGSGGITAFKSFLEAQLFTRNKGVYGAGYDKDFTISYEDDTHSYSTDPSNPGSTADVPSGFSFKTFYAFKYKNAYFVSFEQGTRWWSDTPKSWVEKHLKAAKADPEIQHVFVYMHHPMYSSTMAESGTGEAIGPVRGYYQALFRQYDVTMVFAGHAHVYDRFYVPDDGSASRSTPPKTTFPHDGKGVHYIVTGGGGGPLPNGCNPPPGEAKDVSYDFGQARGCGYHVTHVKVQGAKLVVEIVGVDGSETSFTTKLWDTFSVE